jgi:hypothetical protein
MVNPIGDDIKYVIRRKGNVGGHGDSIGNFFDHLIEVDMKENKTWATVSLRVHSRTRSVSEISNALETPPTSSVDKGARMSMRNPHSAVAEAYLWRLESGLDSTRPLEEHISHMVEFIERKSAALEMLGQDCEIDLFCGYSSENGQVGLVLEADLLKRLTVFPIDVVLDLYNTR